MLKIMGISIPEKDGLYIETGPWSVALAGSGDNRLHHALSSFWRVWAADRPLRLHKPGNEQERLFIEYVTCLWNYTNGKGCVNGGENRNGRAVGKLCNWEWEWEWVNGRGRDTEEEIERKRKKRESRNDMNRKEREKGGVQSVRQMYEIYSAIVLKRITRFWN